MDLMRGDGRVVAELFKAWGKDRVVLYASHDGELVEGCGADGWMLPRCGSGNWGSCLEGEVPSPQAAGLTCVDVV